jgi:hypothetical protein
MFDRLGIITNCWEVVLDNGERFEDLVISFCRQGFKEIEIRDGDYLRRSPFGRFIADLEITMSRYDPSIWRNLCDQLHRGGDWQGFIRDEDRAVMDETAAFIKTSTDAVFSYAMSFQWLAYPQDVVADDRQITNAVKLVYLLNPLQPRLRLVSLDPVEIIDMATAVSNLQRYKALVPDCPVTLVVENALYPAQEILDLARRAGVLVAYDEANNYLNDGSILNTPDEFWQAVRIENLASVHLKQKNDRGVSTRLEDGFVDLCAIVDRLQVAAYSRDILFENAPSDNPLEDAIQSRNYLLEYCT